MRWMVVLIALAGAARADSSSDKDACDCPAPTRAPPPLVLMDLHAAESVAAEVAWRQSSSSVDVASLELRGQYWLSRGWWAFGAVRGAYSSTSAASDTAPGNVLLGARWASWCENCENLNFLALAASVTLPTAGGHGDALARERATFSVPDTYEAFSPHAIGAAVDGLRRVEYGTWFLQVELGLHLLHSPYGADVFADGSSATSSSVFVWTRVGFAAGVRIAGPLSLGADVVGLASLVAAGGSDAPILSARAGVRADYGPVFAALQVRGQYLAYDAGGGPDVLVTIGARR